MKFLSFLTASSIFLLFSSFSSWGVPPPLFYSTHIAPSPLTLPAGRAVIGTTSAFALTSFFQIETEVLSNFYGIYNARIRLSLLEFPKFALGAFLGYQTFNLRTLSSRYPNLQFSAWLPGVSTAFLISPQWALFLSGKVLQIQGGPLSFPFSPSGLLQGTEMNSELSWLYSLPRKGTKGRVLSAGINYQWTYALYGMGISHHWSRLHLGIHYYPLATTSRYLPIFLGSAFLDL